MMKPKWELKIVLDVGMDKVLSVPKTVVKTETERNRLGDKNIDGEIVIRLN